MVTNSLPVTRFPIYFPLNLVLPLHSIQCFVFWLVKRLPNMKWNYCSGIFLQIIPIHNSAGSFVYQWVGDVFACTLGYWTYLYQICLPGIWAAADSRGSALGRRFLQQITARYYIVIRFCKTKISVWIIISPTAIFQLWQNRLPSACATNGDPLSAISASDEQLVDVPI